MSQDPPPLSPPPVPSDDFIIIDDTPASGEDDTRIPSDAEDALDATRIRQRMAWRRAELRGRSWAIIGMIGCGCAVVELAIDVWRERGHVPIQVGLVIGALAAAVGTVHFARSADRRSDHLHDASDPSFPDPDFGPLGDGSHRVTNLESLREGGNSC